MASILKNFSFGFIPILLISFSIKSVSSNDICTNWNSTGSEVIINMNTASIAGKNVGCSCAITFREGRNILYVFDIASTKCGSTVLFTDNSLQLTCENSQFSPKNYEYQYINQNIIFLQITSDSDSEEVMSGSLQITNMNQGGVIFAECFQPDGIEAEKEPEKNTGEKGDTGVIIGIVLGCVFGLLVLIALILLAIILWRRSRRQDEEGTTKSTASDSIIGDLHMDNFYFNSSDELNEDVDKHRVVSPDGEIYTLVHKTGTSSTDVDDPDEYRKDRFLF